MQCSVKWRTPRRRDPVTCGYIGSHPITTVTAMVCSNSTMIIRKKQPVWEFHLEAALLLWYPSPLLDDITQLATWWWSWILITPVSTSMACPQLDSIRLQLALSNGVKTVKSIFRAASLILLLGYCYSLWLTTRPLGLRTVTDAVDRRLISWILLWSSNGLLHSIMSACSFPPHTS
jgi:hypothetical protein